MLLSRTCLFLMLICLFLCIFFIFYSSQGETSAIRDLLTLSLVHLICILMAKVQSEVSIREIFHGLSEAERERLTAQESVLTSCFYCMETTMVKWAIVVMNVLLAVSHQEILLLFLAVCYLLYFRPDRYAGRLISIDKTVLALGGYDKFYSFTILQIGQIRQLLEGEKS